MTWYLTGSVFHLGVFLSRTRSHTLSVQIWGPAALSGEGAWLERGGRCIRDGGAGGKAGCPGAIPWAERHAQKARVQAVEVGNG